MQNIFYIYLNFCNKMNSTNIILYILFFNIFIIMYLFYITTTNFFKIIINFIFLLNMSFLLSFFNADFFSAFLLTAELPIILILIIFYFHKNSLQIDNLYKYKNFSLKKNYFFILFSILFFIFYQKNNLLFTFYNFFINDLYSISNKNDFLTIFYVYYKFNNVYIYIFAILIFFVSLLIIFLYQLNKIYSFKQTDKKKNIIFLRKQNMLKQSVYNSKLKFFNKKN